MEMRVIVLFFAICLIGCGPSKEDELKTAMLEIERLLALKDKTAEIVMQQEFNILTEKQKHASYLKAIQDTIDYLDNRTKFVERWLSIYDDFIQEKSEEIKRLKVLIEFDKERIDISFLADYLADEIKKNQVRLKEAQGRLKSLQITRSEQAVLVERAVAQSVKYRESIKPELDKKVTARELVIEKMESDLETTKAAFDSLSALHTNAVFRLSTMTSQQK